MSNSSMASMLIFVARDYLLLRNHTFLISENGLILEPSSVSDKCTY